MRSSPRLRTFTLVATLAIVAASGCADNPEAVGVRLEKAKLVIENRSGTDVYYRVTGFRSEDFVPASLPGVRVRPGARLALDVDDPFVRDQGLAVHWWHEGDPLEGTDVRGADRVRKAVFSPRQVAAALPPLPDPEAARATGEVLLAACKERTLVGTWADRRARGLETASGPPDLRDEAVPAGCLALLRECTKLTRCDIVAVEQKDARDAMRAQVGYQPPAEDATAAGDTDVVGGEVAVVASAGRTVAQSLPGEVPVGQQLLAACRERTLLDSWDRKMNRRPAERLAPPDFSSAPIPWGCRDLARACEARDSCRAALDQERRQLDTLRQRVARS